MYRLIHAFPTPIPVPCGNPLGYADMHPDSAKSPSPLAPEPTPLQAHQELCVACLEIDYTTTAAAEQTSHEICQHTTRSVCGRDKTHKTFQSLVVLHRNPHWRTGIKQMRLKATLKAPEQVIKILSPKDWFTHIHTV